MKILPVILLLLHYTFFCVAQTYRPAELHFNYLGVKDGLPEGTINALLQDREGYFWMGTQNGLIRYNGYTVKKYALYGSNMNSLSIIKIYEDRKNNLWIGTLNGVYFYDRSADSVITQELFKQNKGNCEVSRFLDDRKGNVWINFYDVEKKVDCLGLLNTDTRHFTVFSSKEHGVQYLNTTKFYTPFIDKHDHLWVAADNSLLEYSPTEKKFKARYFDSAHKTIDWFESEDPVKHEDFWYLMRDKKSNQWEGLAKYNIYEGSSIVFKNINTEPNDIFGYAGINFTDTRKRVWFCTGKGLLLYDSLKGGFTSFDIKEKAENKYDNLILWAIEDKSANFWCWTGRGLLYFNTVTGNYTRYVYNEKNAGGVLSNRINHLSLDNYGLPWFGVAQNGLQWLNKDRSKFTVYKNNPGQLHHFPGGKMSSFAEALDGTCWIGSQHGLYQWLPALDSFTFIRFEKNVSKNVSTRAVFADKDGLVWFSAFVDDFTHGLYCYDPVTKNTKNFRYKKNDSLSLSNENITSIIEDNKGLIWIGTFGGGVCSFDKRTQRFRRYPYVAGDNYKKPKRDSLDDNEVESMYQDKQGTFWVGTNNGGLNKFNRPKGAFTSYLNDSPNFFCVVSINDDNRGNIWAGTYFGGLFLLNTKANTIRKFSEKDGLLYDGCWGIQQDNRNNLWVASQRGFSVLNLQTNKIRNITSANGLPAEPGQFGLYKTSKGNLLFGCKDGFVFFNPDDFARDTIVPVVHIETIVFNKYRSNSNKEKDSSVVRYGKDKINLTYNQNRLTFGYVGLIYQNALLVKYAYKLAGYDNDWIQAGTQRTATYTNLSPGTYTFHVKAANSEEVWTTKEDTIIVIISPPWWKTWWAYLIYLVLFAAALRAYIVYRSRSLRRQNRLLEEKVEYRTRQLSEANKELKITQEEVITQRDQLVNTVGELKSTQSQLIQSEKMASLGELTAGIAHEIQTH